MALLMPLATMKNKVILTKTVKPSCPTPNHLRFLPASLFDRVNSPVLTPLVFFFSSQNTQTNTYSTNEVLDRLKGSLPITLSVFYPLAGRIDDAHYIDCNDEGVPYVETQVDKPLEDVVHKAEVSELDKLFPPYGEQVYSRLLLAIQVNVFECGGLAIGVMMSHAIADGFSIFMFVKTWASIANGKDPHTLLNRPYFDTWKLFPAQTNELGSVHDDQNPNLIPDKHVTKWFVFSEAKLKSIRSKLYSHMNTVNKSNNEISSKFRIRTTSLPMILCAFIWSRIMVSCHNNVNAIPCEVLNALNLRSRLSPPAENSYYFGNLYTLAIAKPSFVMYNNNEDKYMYDETLWYEFLKQSDKSMRKIIGRHESFIRGLEEGKEDLSFVADHFDRKRRGEIMSMDFSILRSLPVYEADFGWGKPVWVAAGSQKFKDFVLLIDSAPESNDIVAYVVLSCKDMAKLENDAEFMLML